MTEQGAAADNACRNAGLRELIAKLPRRLPALHPSFEGTEKGEGAGLAPDRKRYPEHTQNHPTVVQIAPHRTC